MLTSALVCFIIDARNFCNPLSETLSPRGSAGSVEDLRTVGRWFEPPARPIFFSFVCVIIFCKYAFQIEIKETSIVQRDCVKH